MEAVAESFELYPPGLSSDTVVSTLASFRVIYCTVLLVVLVVLLVVPVPVEQNGCEEFVVQWELIKL
jgi:hypothetical protein